MQQFQHILIDMLAIGIDLIQRRTREYAARIALWTVTHGVVIRIEQDPECGIAQPVAGETRREQERLEEPARVAEMPLDRTRIGHRLDQAVFGRERSGERFGCGAHRAIALRESGRGARGSER